MRNDFKLVTCGLIKKNKKINFDFYYVKQMSFLSIDILSNCIGHYILAY